MDPAQRPASMRTRRKEEVCIFTHIHACVWGHMCEHVGVGVSCVHVHVWGGTCVNICVCMHCVHVHVCGGTCVSRHDKRQLERFMALPN